MKTVIEEIKKIRWSDRKTLLTNTINTIIFTVGFALLFFGFQYIIGLVMEVLWSL